MKTMLLTLQLAAITAFFGASATAAIAEDSRVYSATELREDLALVRRALEESQVGLDWYLPREQYVRQMEAVFQKTNQPMTVREFYRLLLPVIASIGHGHTTLERPNAGKGYYLRRLARLQTYFPAEMRVIEGRLFVLTDLSGDCSLPAGSEILALNGQPFEELYPRLSELLSTEGDNRTFRDHQLGRGWRLHDLLDLEQGPRARHEITLRSSDGSIRYVSVDGATPAQLASRYEQRRGHALDTFQSAVRFRMLDANTGLLTVSSFWEGLLPKDTPDFRTAFDAAFVKVAKANTGRLIIDVRSNEGGDGAAARLLRAYLATAPFVPGGGAFVAQPSLSTLKYANAPSDEVRAFAADPMQFVALAADGRWRLKPELDAEATSVVQPEVNAFKGPVVILIDGGAFSATNIFLDLMRCEAGRGRSVRFIGVSNAQSDRYPLVSGGQSVEIELPNTMLKLALPVLGSDRPGSADCRNTAIPDIELSASINDLIVGRDPVLEQAIADTDPPMTPRQPPHNLRIEALSEELSRTIQLVLPHARIACADDYAGRC